MKINGERTMKREIVKIDEEKCDGCGLCVPSCAEGAIRLVDGKAKLIADNLCDGLGACLGDCPQDAITIEVRESSAYDEVAVEQHLRQERPAPPAAPSGCPGSRMIDFTKPAAAAAPATPVAPASPAFPMFAGAAASEEAPRLNGVLRHWPIQLHLLPPDAPALRGAELLVCAPCVPVSMPDFHARLLNGRAVVLACPKLDDQTGYVEKLTQIFAHSGVTSVTVARMVVPCCGGLLQTVSRARELSGSDTPLHDIVVGPDGYLVSNQEVPA